MNLDQVVPVSEDLLRQLDLSGPRYTAYPMADRFVEAFGADDYAQALQQRRSGAAAMTLPLSLYVHVPFCESLCYFCARTKIITRQHDRAATYLRYLSREVDLHTALLGSGRAVSQLHLGGGTPTFFTDDELRELMAMLRRNFNLMPDGVYAIEVDPRTVDATRLDTLKALGFNRLTVGIQDFDPAVQKAVHRVQPAPQVFEVLALARERGFQSINLELIYGLPLQTPESFERTLQQVVALRPERVALYAYTHRPDRYKSQRRMASASLPAAGAKAAMRSRSLATLTDAGYVHVGMDQFALPTDSLAVAKRQGRLNRSFQGYSAQPDCDLIGLGVSAMSRIGAIYSQNAKTLEEYCDDLDLGRFPVTRGLALSRDDLIRRAVIMAVMCQGEVLFESIELGYLIKFSHYFGRELDALQEWADQGVLVLSPSGFQLTEQGLVFVAAVAMVFDRYAQADQARARFSRII